MMDGITLSTIFQAAAGLAAGGVGITALAKTFYTTGPKETALVTRLGKLVHKVDDPGLHVKVPFIDQIAKRVGQELQQVTETLESKTADDLFVKLPISIQFEVTDPERFHFGNSKPIDNLKRSVSAAVRTVTSGKQFQELYGDRDEIGSTVIEHVQNDAADYGIFVKRIIIDEPQAPAEVQNAFNEVRASERLKAAAQNKADAHAIEVVAKARADAEAQKLAGTGAADFRKAILDGYKTQIEDLTKEGTVTKDEALRIVERSMELDALREVAERGNLIITPERLSSGGLAEVQTLRQLATKGPA
ncbi:MAG: SPFH domain-containing protein [Alphaproteobacteria bacterium]|nr:SPFH domain-containing protein [Alphaproteobacteria bacterium]